MIKRVIWSPVEVEYLQKHKGYPIMQLCIALTKSKYAINKKLAELKPGALPPSGKTKNNIYKSRIGKRKDCNNLFFRSSWEANCYRYWKTLKDIILIEYEPVCFSFTPFGILRGTVSYTPDFKLTYKDKSYEYVEVKGGFMRNVDKTKLRRLKKYYPDDFDKLRGITPGEKSKTATFFRSLNIPILHYYPELNKKYNKIISGWE